VLFTDFGLQGPYTGQVKAVLQQRAPGIPVIDLFADAPVGNPMASAYLLAAYAPWFPPKTVFLCVIDRVLAGRARPSFSRSMNVGTSALATVCSNCCSAAPKEPAVGK
jgi:S-adenosyl-L-methionine hydrolase (adenosine-forming)